MNRIKNASVYVLAYSLWVVSMVFGYFVISKGRDALLSILVAATYGRYASDAEQTFYTAKQVKAADVWSYILLGLGLIIMIVVLEHVYRMAAQNNQVWPRFSQVTLIEFAVMGICELVIALSAGVVKPLSASDFLLPLVYLVAAGLFWWLWRTLRAPKMAT